MAHTSTTVEPDQSRPDRLDADVVIQRTGSDADRGLTGLEAAARLARHGDNKLEAEPPIPSWRKLLAQFADPLVILLLVAIAISLLAWALEGPEGFPFDAIIIAGIVAANAGIGLWQESKAQAAVAALQRMAAPRATVIRDGEPQELVADGVVPGDLMVLGAGDAVVADARLVEIAALKVAEAALTGESEPVLKTIDRLDGPTVIGDRTNMVFSGTSVVSGTGQAVVTATGMATEIGRIARMLDRTKEVKTPLQNEISLVSRVLGLAVMAIALIVAGAILLTTDINSGRDLVDVLLVGVSLAVAAVPEGLPAILAVVLALGVQRMADNNAVVKKLSSVETLGSASVICSDKTGTLTRNEMTIERLVSASGEATITGSGYRPEGQIMVAGRPLIDGPMVEEVQLVLGGGSLSSNGSIRIEEGVWTVQGDPTEAAFLVAEAKIGATEDRINRFERVAEIPFSSERKLMSTIQADNFDGQRRRLVTKGAPDLLLEHCSHERAAGKVIDLTADRRREILDGVDAMADQALRTLAVAYRRLDEIETGTDESLEQGLTYLGSVGIIDPPRPEAEQAVAEAQAAGIRIVMITGDHPRTAGKIAEQLGIVPAPASVLSGLDIDGSSDDEFRDAVRTCSVFARVAPEHKLRIVAALQQDGNVVAMTGDGVNDAPALRAADIGVAMGITGTDVSKEAAKMILADDNFATILTAVREGRSIFGSIRKFLRYLLSSNIGEVLTMFLGVVGAGLLGLDGSTGKLAVPLLATHILWINLLTDAAPALALGVDPPVGDTMSRPPRKMTDRIIDREMLLGVLLTGLVMAAATLVAMDLAMVDGLFDGTGDLTQGQTVAFTTLVLAQLFNAFASRSARLSAGKHLFSNRLLWAAVGLSLSLQILVVHLPALNTAFRTTPLTAGQWTLCAAAASTVLIVDELKKLIVSTRTGRSGD